MGFDNLRIHFPLRMLATSQVKQGLAPLWNPFNFSGNTLLATYQSAIFHPLSWLYLLLPGIDAWSVIILLQPFLGLVFFFLFLREIGYSRLASGLGSMTFALSGTLLVWWEEAYVAGYTAIGLPLALLAIEKFQKRGGRVNFTLVVLGFIWLLVSGWFQFTLYSFIFIGLWCWYRVYILHAINCKRMLLVLCALVVAVLLSGIHLLPAAEAYIHSPRASTDAKYLFDGYLMPLSHLATIIAPDFFGNPATYSFFGKGFYYEHVMYFGVVSLVFVLYALQMVSVRDKKAIPGYFFLFFLSLGLALPTSWFLLYTLHLPLISVLIPSRIFFLSTVSAAILAAEGMERFSEKPQGKKMLTVLGLLGVMLSGMWMFVLYMKYTDPQSSFATVTLRNLVLPTVMCVLTLLLQIIAFNRVWRKAALWSLLLVAGLGSVYMANKYLYFSEARFVYPDVPVITTLREKAGINRVWGFGDAVLENNFSTMLGLYTIEGYDSFFIGRYGELLWAAANNGVVSHDIPRADARLSAQQWGGKYFVHPQQAKILALLGVKYLFGTNTGTEEDAPFSGTEPLKRIWHDSAYAIYESGSAYPRVFFVDNYVIRNSDQEIVSTMFADTTDLRRTVVLERDPQIGHVDASEYTANVISYTPHLVSVETKSEKDAILFLSDVYFPGWRVYIDGNRRDILRANYTFRSVVVPAGTHLVEWRYEPDSWRFGWVMFTGGVLLFCMIIFYYKPGAVTVQRSRKKTV